MKKLMEKIIILIATFGFFGFIYPELCLIEDTYIIVEEEPLAEDVTTNQMETKIKNTISVEQYMGKLKMNKPEDTEQGSKKESDKDVLQEICNLPPEKIRVKSKLLECLRGVEEKD